MNKRGGRKIWVDETLCETLTEAASLVGVPVSSLYQLLRFGGEVILNGRRIAETPPKRAVKEEMPPKRTANGGALLRYAPGELLKRGLPGAWR